MLHRRSMAGISVEAEPAQCSAPVSSAGTRGQSSQERGGARLALSRPPSSTSSLAWLHTMSLKEKADFSPLIY